MLSAGWRGHRLWLWALWHLRPRSSPEQQDDSRNDSQVGINQPLLTKCGSAVEGLTAGIVKTDAHIPADRPATLASKISHLFNEDSGLRSVHPETSPFALNARPWMKTDFTRLSTGFRYWLSPPRRNLLHNDDDIAAEPPALGDRNTDGFCGAEKGWPSGRQGERDRGSGAPESEARHS